MAANEIRDTPGRMLLGWAVLLGSLVVLSWRIHLHPADYEWVEYPTALGDTKYYTTQLGKDDRYEPNLRLPGPGTGQERGLYRRSEEPVSLEDATMLKVALDASGRHFIYQPAPASEASPPAPAAQAAAAVYYLKAGENRYIEFGARKFYPPFVPKAGPQ